MSISSFFKGYHQLLNTFNQASKGLSDVALKQAHQLLPNISQYLPWLDYDHQTQTLVLEDGQSVAGFLKLSDIPSDALSLQDLTTLRNKMTVLFQGIIPFDLESPWHLQFYLEDDYNLAPLIQDFDQKVQAGYSDHPFTQAYRRCLLEHLEYVSKPQGIFRDSHLTGQAFRGKNRGIRLCLYRRLKNKGAKRFFTIGNKEEANQLNAILSSISAHLTGLGAKVLRMQASDIFSWLWAWFNPKLSAQRLLNACNKNLPYGFDWSEHLFYSHPEGDPDQGIWYFNQEPHRFLSIDALSQIPDIGQLTHVKSQGFYRSGLFDQLPEYCRFMMSIVVVHPDRIAKKIGHIKKSCVGDHAESNLTRACCEQALSQHEEGNYLFPCSMGIYVYAPHEEALQEKCQNVTALMIQQGFKVIPHAHEIYPLHAYLRYLPANYHYELDTKIRRSRLIYTQQIANLLPLYGQYKASGRLCFSYFTRSGENFSFDPFNIQDKSANSHLLFLAETGGGKSAALVYHLMQVIALYHPRVFIIEAGDSFKLLCDYAAMHGLSTHQVKLAVEHPIALNPFADLLSLSQRLEVQKSTRDYLGEMLLAAELMVTGGDPQEELRMTRANRAILLKGIEGAIEYAHRAQAPEVLTEHVVASLYHLAQSEENLNKSSRIQEMADAMSHFVQDPFSSSFFNCPGTPWPVADITRLDMGIMKGAQYSAQLAIAVMSMLSRILNRAEEGQYGQRMTIVLIDEAHILTKNRLTAQHITQFSKMCRKLGMWLWLATQNLSDFPEESKKMLSMIEFWVGLGTSEQEIDEMKRYKQITPEEKALFMSLRKEIPHYVEGVVLSRKIKGLFRNIPPRLALALGMSEQSEKASRQKMMQEYGCTEVEAAIKIAERMIQP